ncbi:hypothetical protein EG68_03294, partial [Paragonimus skrjabini miyazakii]
DPIAKFNQKTTVWDSRPLDAHVFCKSCLSRGRSSLCTGVQCTISDTVYFCQNEKCIHFILPYREDDLNIRTQWGPYSDGGSNQSNDRQCDALFPTGGRPPVSISERKMSHVADSGFEETGSAVQQSCGSTSFIMDHTRTVLTPPTLPKRSTLVHNVQVHQNRPRQQRRTSAKRLLTYRDYRRVVLHRARTLAGGLQLCASHNRLHGSNNSTVSCGSLDII